MGFALSDIELTSTAFRPHGGIPRRFSGEGDNISPPMAWRNPPGGTRGYAVICHDPDAPLVSPNGTYGFVHWVLYNLPASVTSLPEGTDEFTTGWNDTGNLGYSGPMPPTGHGLHQYYFWILALDVETNLASGLTLWQLLERIEANVIGMNRLVGAYERS